MGIFVEFCKGLRFDEEPNYEFIKKNLKNLFVKSGFDYDFNFDWCSNQFVKVQNKLLECPKEKPIPIAT